MKISERILQRIVVGTATIWTIIGVWGLLACYRMAKVLKYTQKLHLRNLKNFDTDQPYLFSFDLIVPYAAFATGTAMSVFVIYAVYKYSTSKD